MFDQNNNKDFKNLQNILNTRIMSEAMNQPMSQQQKDEILSILLNKNQGNKSTSTQNSNKVSDSLNRTPSSPSNPKTYGEIPIIPNPKLKPGLDILNPELDVSPYDGSGRTPFKPYTPGSKPGIDIPYAPIKPKIGIPDYDGSGRIPRKELDQLNQDPESRLRGKKLRDQLQAAYLEYRRRNPSRPRYM